MKYRPLWKRHAGEVAWPTLALIGAIVIGEIGVWGAVLFESMSYGLGFVLCTALAYLAFTVGHEAVHGNIAGRQKDLKRLEAACGHVAAFFLLAPYAAFRVLHLQHHAHVNEGDADPDHWVASASPIGVVGRCATIMPYYYYTILFGPSSRTRAGQRVRRQSILTLTSFVAIALTASLWGYATPVLALWIGPAAVASAFLAFAFDWLPHHPHSSTERYHDTRVILGPGMPLLTMWQSYHLVHHLYPRVPFYRYGTCFRDIRPELEAEGSVIEGWEPGSELPPVLSTPWSS
jgi:fatty acid desaturase